MKHMLMHHKISCIGEYLKADRLKPPEDPKKEPFTREDFHQLIKKAITVPAPKPEPKDK
jgi:hypothetical protein